MIRLEHISKKYLVAKDTYIDALNDISIEFPSIGLITINGKSGCGKTTFLNVIGLLDNFDSGEIYFHDTPISSLSKSQQTLLKRKEIGFVFQDYNLLNDFNVMENIQISSMISKISIDKDTSDEIIKTLNISDLMDRKISELSGGQKQRVAIARAMLKGCKVLLCDEPTGALDPENAESFFRLLKKISKDILVIVVSHDINLSRKYADQTIEIENGKLLTELQSSNDLVSGLTIHKEKLPLRLDIKIGLRLLKNQLISFMVLILLSVLSFILLGLSLTLSSYDTNKSISASLLENDRSFISYTIHNDSYDTISQFEDITSTNDYVYSYSNTYDFSSITTNNFSVNNMVLYDEEILEKYNIILVSGNAPKNYNEVLINNFTYEVLKHYSNMKINSYDDVIGMYIDGRTITGVVNVPINNYLLDNISDINDHESKAYKVLSDEYTEGMINSYYVGNIPIDFFEKDNACFCIEDEFVSNYASFSGLEKENDNLLMSYDHSMFNNGGIIINLNSFIDDVIDKDEAQNRMFNYSSSLHISLDEAKKKVIEDYNELYQGRQFELLLVKESHTNILFNLETTTVAGFYFSNNSEDFIVSNKYLSYKDYVYDTKISNIFHHIDSSNVKKYVDIGMKDLTISNNITRDSSKVNFNSFIKDMVEEKTNSFITVSRISLVVSILIMVFVVVLLFHQTRKSINDRIRDIGILDSLGMNSFDFVMIFSLNGLISFIINISLGFIGVYSLIPIFNKSLNGSTLYKLIILIPSLNIFIILLLIALVVPLLGLILPLNGMRKKSTREKIYYYGE